MGGPETGLKLRAQEIGLVLYRAFRHPLTPGHLVTDLENRKVSFEPFDKGINFFKIEDFDPKQAEEFLDGWEYRPMDLTGWSFSRSFDEVQYNLQVLNIDNGWVSLNTTGVSELKLGGVRSVELKPELRQLSFLGRSGSYHITGGGLTHFLQNSDKSLTARKLFKP